jgi:16S rRNA (guanine1207-N2)-methyltransferase
MLHSSLLAGTVQLAIHDRLLILNSAADPFVVEAARLLSAGELILAEDNIASLHTALYALEREHAKTQLRVRHVPFHEYTLNEAPANIDVAVMNMLYQPGNTWMIYGLQVAAYALKPGGRLYVVGAKDRGVLSMAKRMQSLFGNLETLIISKGQRVLCSHKDAGTQLISPGDMNKLIPTIFAEGKLDEGTRLLLEALEVRTTDVALDIGCGAGYIGMHIARLASKGHVTMVDASLATVDAARRKVEQSGLTNVMVLASDGTKALPGQRFDLVVTNPPFHLGGIQTTEIGERFIREAAQVLRPRGRLYLVANRFLKYEPAFRTCFQTVEEVGGNTRYKVLRATNAIVYRSNDKNVV